MDVSQLTGSHSMQGCWQMSVAWMRSLGRTNGVGGRNEDAGMSKMQRGTEPHEVAAKDRACLGMCKTVVMGRPHRHKQGVS